MPDLVLLQKASSPHHGACAVPADSGYVFRELQKVSRAIPGVLSELRKALPGSSCRRPPPGESRTYVIGHRPCSCLSCKGHDEEKDLEYEIGRASCRERVCQYV